VPHRLQRLDLPQIAITFAGSSFPAETLILRSFG
jgi:hypothetical protein